MSDRDEVADWGSRKLNAADRRDLCRALAVRKKSQRKLADEFGVSHQYVSKFARQRAREIKAIRADLDDRFAGLWIASKEARLAALQADYELSLAGDYAGHYEHIRTRAALLRAVAEELGQLPRGNTAVIVPVVHVLEGIGDLGALK